MGIVSAKALESDNVSRRRDLFPTVNTIRYAAENLALFCLPARISIYPHSTRFPENYCHLYDF